jgi:hypothetical protein
MGNEQQILDRVADLVDCPKAGNNVSPYELADFLVGAVTRDEKTTIAAAQSILPSISKVGSSFMSMCRGEAVCGGDEEDEDGPRPVKIIALPKEYLEPSKKQWPIILFDDVNFDFEQRGLFSTFLYAVAQQASGLEMIFYVVTTERRVAYMIWQLNGGNWIQSHEALQEHHSGRAQSLEDLAELDTKLVSDDLKVLNARKVPKNWFFKSDPFIFDKKAKADLMFNVYSPTLEREYQRNALLNDIESLLVKHPNRMIDSLLKELIRLDYERFDNNRNA